MLKTETFKLGVPITTRGREYAKKFAAEQTTAAKATRVFLNTLAVYAVHEYLKITEIETVLEASDSWHPVMRQFHDVADLVIVNLGTLECRPVLPEETEIMLPPEVTEERIGYLLVGFNEELTEAELLGFLPMFDPEDAPEKIEIDDLEPLESLFDCLIRLEDANNLWSSSEDKVFARVNERLETECRADFIVKLEWIFRNKEDFEWQFATKELLESYTGEPKEYAESLKNTQREEIGGSGNIELDDLAGNLMEKLAEIWKE